MILIEVEWKDGDTVERCSFGGNTTIENLVLQAENHFKDKKGEGEVIRFVNGDEEYRV